MKARKNSFPLLHKRSKNWILFLMVLSTLQLLLSIPYLFILLTTTIPTYNSQIGEMMLIGDSILFILLIYAIRNPVVLYGYLVIKPFENVVNASPENSNDADNSAKALASRPMDVMVSSTQMDGFIEGIKQYMTQEKPWLQADFDISRMASDLGKPVHHCSYILNEGMGISFRDCINQHRVEYFIEKYPQNIGVITLEAMSKEAGFSNRVSFNMAFKKTKGVSPSEFFSKEKFISA